MPDQAEIYCPHCRWRPGFLDRWACVPACGARWNTFWTRGVCPSCTFNWATTQCLACGEFSPHEAWYHPRRPPERADETATDGGGERVA